jgi:hypothetical protein
MLDLQRLPLADPLADSLGRLFGQYPALTYVHCTEGPRRLILSTRASRREFYPWRTTEPSDAVVGGHRHAGHEGRQEACAPKTSRVTMPQRQSDAHRTADTLQRLGVRSAVSPSIRAARCGPVNVGAGVVAIIVRN